MGASTSRLGESLRPITYYFNGVVEVRDNYMEDVDFSDFPEDEDLSIIEAFKRLGETYADDPSFTSRVTTFMENSLVTAIKTHNVVSLKTLLSIAVPNPECHPIAQQLLSQQDEAMQTPLHSPSLLDASLSWLSVQPVDYRKRVLSTRDAKYKIPPLNGLVQEIVKDIQKRCDFTQKVRAKIWFVFDILSEIPVTVDVVNSLTKLNREVFNHSSQMSKRINALVTYKGNAFGEIPLGKVRFFDTLSNIDLTMLNGIPLKEKQKKDLQKEIVKRMNCDRLSFKDFHMRESDAKSFVKDIGDLLEYLCIKNSRLRFSSNEIAELLLLCPNLKVLKIDLNDLTPDKMEQLFSSILNLKKLVELDLNCTPTDKPIVASDLKRVASMTGLETLKIAIKVDDSFVTELVACLGSFTKLKELGLTLSFGTLLSFPVMETLKVLHLNYDELPRRLSANSPSMIALGASLSNLPNLKKLFIYNSSYRIREPERLKSQTLILNEDNQYIKDPAHLVNVVNTCAEVTMDDIMSARKCRWEE